MKSILNKAISYFLYELSFLKKKSKEKYKFTEQVIHNETLEDGIVLTTALFNRAKSRIKIVSGKLNHDFYMDSRVQQALRRALRRGVHIEIIFGPDIDKRYFEKKDLPELKELIKKCGIEMYQLPYRNGGHFTVVDGKHVRVEEYHPPTSETSVRNGYVAYNVRGVCRDLEQIFGNLRKEGKRYNLEEELVGIG